VRLVRVHSQGDATLPHLTDFLPVAAGFPAVSQISSFGTPLALLV
jgi:hypothetical protein